MCVVGGELVRSLLECHLVVSVEPAVIPVLPGDGVPFLPHPGKQARLQLTPHRIEPKSGTVYLEYVPA